MSGCDRKERTVRSVLNGPSVLFYHNHSTLVSSLSEMLMRIRGEVGRGKRAAGKKGLARSTAAQIIWLLLPWKSYKGARVLSPALLIANFSFLETLREGNIPVQRVDF